MQAPYLGFLWPVCKAAAGSPVFLLDVPHVALRPFRRAKNVDAIASAVHAILNRHGLPQACFAGHSFGSFCVSRICQLHPEIVDSIVSPSCNTEADACFRANDVHLGCLGVLVMCMHVHTCDACLATCSSDYVSLRDCHEIAIKDPREGANVCRNGAISDVRRCTQGLHRTQNGFAG